MQHLRVAVWHVVLWSARASGMPAWMWERHYVDRDGVADRRYTRVTDTGVEVHLVPGRTAAK